MAQTQLNPKVGQTIHTQDGRHGVIRYSGPLHIATGDWLGLELPDDTGKNDGSVKGERYFQCAPGYGIFVRKESVAKIVKQAAAAPRPNGTTPTPNEATTKPRPSGVMPADMARKRQSLMSQGSGATAASRLSVRSPTKSPSKAVSSASSAASTPRTGTPATTARTSDSSTKSRPSTTGRVSMAPPPAPAKTTTTSSRPSIGGATRTVPKSTPSPGHPSLAGSRLSVDSRPTSQSTKRAGQPTREDLIRSPTIEEEEQEEDIQSIDSRFQGIEQTDSGEPQQEEHEPTSPTASRNGATLPSRTTAASVESRTADKRENEQLKAKIRTLEKKAMDNRDKLKTFDALHDDKNKYEKIIEALQKKMKANSQEMVELKSRYEDAERRVGEGAGRSAEHESEIELATLDKEMAEERAEMYSAELEALKLRHEELELEVDVLREENRELGSVMSPEEKADAGWMQMEKERDRLRQALILLRDMSQQNESQLRAEIKELQHTLDELEGTATKYTEVSEKFARIEETNKHLMEQLELAEANDDVVVAMEAQREQSSTTIEQLRRQIQEFEEHIQVTDELESFHVDEEKRLHYQLDESEALLSETLRKTTEQEKVIGDLEYSLTKFREVVSGLQGDIDELRRSRDLNEVEAHELGSKSRAMMDLNLQLQNSASKGQLKTIDYEMGKMQAEQAQSHLDIVQLFVPETFDQDRNPVLALLCFKRIEKKAALTKHLLTDRMRDRPQLAEDDPFTVFEVMEKMGRIVTLANRAIHFMSSCSPEEFGRYSGALHELEPVERSMTAWVDALKRDELGEAGPDLLQRMIGILQDMAEKFITEGGESKATELLAQSRMAVGYADSTAVQLSAIVNAVQSRLGRPTQEDEESLVFDKKMDHFATRARTIKYLGGKVTQLLLDLRSGSMCLGEATWTFFEEVEFAAEKVASLVRDIGKAVISDLAKVEHDEPPSYHSIITLMTSTSQKSLLAHEPRAIVPDDVFALLTTQLAALQAKVDDLQSKASDIPSAAEFETKPSPWTVRAKEIKVQKVISLDTQQELSKLQTKAAELVRLLAEREKLVEELGVKVELLERRNKEVNVNVRDVKALTTEMEKIQGENRDIRAEMEKTKAEYDVVLQKHKAERQELEALKSAALEGGATAVVTNLGDQSETAKLLKVEVDTLTAEILSLQSAVRYLQTENAGLRVPVGEIALLAERNAWLRPENLAKKHHVASKGMAERRAARDRVKKQGDDVLGHLIDLATNLKPVRLSKKDGEGLGWKKLADTRYQVARQREELARWEDWRDDVVRRGRMELRDGLRPEPMARRSQGVFDSAMEKPATLLEKKSTGKEGGQGQLTRDLKKSADGSADGKQVRFVENSP